MNDAFHSLFEYCASEASNCELKLENKTTTCDLWGRLYLGEACIPYTWHLRTGFGTSSLLVSIIIA